MGDQAVEGKNQAQIACLAGAARYGLDPDEYSWEELRDELIVLAGQPQTPVFSDWHSFCECFDTLAEAVQYVNGIPDDDELIELARTCECVADEDLDWPEYRAEVLAEIRECWPDN